MAVALNIQNAAISRCCFVKNGKEMNKELLRMLAALPLFAGKV